MFSNGLLHLFSIELFSPLTKGKNKAIIGVFVFSVLLHSVALRSLTPYLPYTGTTSPSNPTFPSPHFPFLSFSSSSISPMLGDRVSRVSQTHRHQRHYTPSSMPPPHTK